MRYFVLILIVVLFQSCVSLKEKKTLGKTLWSAPDRKPSDDVILITPFWSTNEAVGGPQSAYLTNLQGEILKEWIIRGNTFNSKLGPNGWLYSLKLTPAVSPERFTTNGGECDEIYAVDNHNTEKFSLKLKGMTHDFTFVDQNKIAVFRLEKLNAKELRKFVPNSLKEFSYADRLSVVDFSGTETWFWSVKDHIAELKYVKINDESASLTTGNSIQFVKENPISKKPGFLLSYRTLNIVVLVEYPSGKVLWQTPPKLLNRQHDATISGSRVLIFDNNLFTEDSSLKVHELDLLEKKRVFFWTPAWWASISSSLMGGVRHLSNGSYLISNALAGNLFEIDQKGDIKWSFLVNPDHAKGQYRWTLGTGFYRAEVYTAAEYKTILDPTIKE